MRCLFSLFAAASMLIAQPSLAANITVENHSSWEIHEIYLSPSNQASWGNDRLGEYVLESGMRLPLTGIRPGNWDIRLVDEDEDVCVLEDVTVGESETWKIDDDDLLNCQAGTDE